MDAPGRRLGSFEDAVKDRAPAKRRFRIAPPGRPPVVALIIPAARSRPINLDVPAGVTVYEFDPAKGVRILRQGGPWWSPELIPQRCWLWAYKTPSSCLPHQIKLREAQGDQVQHDTVLFYRSREKFGTGRHPLEYEVARKYLYSQLDKAVIAQIGGQGESAELDQVGGAEPE